MKYFVTLLFALMSSFVFAQDLQEPIEDNVSSGVTVLTDKLDMSKVGNDKIKDVVLKFCNDGFEQSQLSSKLNLILRPNQKKRICTVFVNQSDVPLTILANVVSGTINNNGNVVCSDKGELSGDISVFDFEQISGEILIEPGQEVRKSFSIFADESASGNYYGCLAINLNNSQKLSDGSPFNLVIRKAANMTFSVVGSPYRFQRFDDIIFLLRKNIRNISKVGFAICALLFLYVLIPEVSKKKKSS